MPNNQDRILAQCKAWVSDFVIALNLCPFAKREFDAGRVRFVLNESGKRKDVLEHLADELQKLENQAEIETTLLILSRGFQNFTSFLEFMDLANELLISMGLEGTFQLASFHPAFQFEGEEEGGASNYTNRSPYPMIHLLREASISRAVDSYGAIDDIPQRNIQQMDEIGQRALQERLERLQACD